MRENDVFDERPLQFLSWQDVQTIRAEADNNQFCRDISLINTAYCVGYLAGNRAKEKLPNRTPRKSSRPKATPEQLREEILERFAELPPGFFEVILDELRQADLEKQIAKAANLYYTRKERKANGRKEPGRKNPGSETSQA